jgi:hypothetical protein
MSVNRPMPMLQIRWVGMFDFDELMKVVRGFLKDRTFFVREPKYKQKGSKNNREVEFEIAATRRDSGYVKQSISVFLLITDYKDVDVIENNEKKTKQHGGIVIEINGTLTIDANDRFSGSDFMQKLHDFYIKKVIKQEIEEKWETQLYTTMFKYSRAIKKALGAETHQ